MTREEQIGLFIKKSVEGIEDSDTRTAAAITLAAGIHWADQHPAWVSVEDELPEVGEKVIFYSPDLDDWLSGAIQSDGRWWSEEYASHFTDVPLWMKPQLPRKD